MTQAEKTIAKPILEDLQSVQEQIELLYKRGKISEHDFIDLDNYIDDLLSKHGVNLDEIDF